MNNSDRRTFMLQAVVAGTALAGARAHAQAGGPKLEESDPQAIALGYKQDSTKVDGKKYPNHANAQTCGTCQLFLGKAGDAAGGCPLFAGKQVAGAGWCSAWAKKAS